MNKYKSTIIIAVAIITGASIIAYSYNYKYRSGKTVSVTGMAEKDFISDLVVWSGDFNRTNLDLKTAYSALKNDESTIRSYLNAKGIPDNEIVFSSINVTKNYKRSYDERGIEVVGDFSGYTLAENVKVESKDIERVEKLSREITELLEKDIELASNSPEYYFTRLNELKIDLLAKASQDAKLRAETIAKNSAGTLGSIKKANMGVFQITGKNSNEDYSYGGAFNTSSKFKTASITLKVDYLVH
jgi:hypothetical protein